MDYQSFIARMAQLKDDGGFAPLVMPDHLFDFQQYLVDFALRSGRSAIFADCGMGKTAMELAWAENVFRKTGKPVLILTPLAVGAQFVTEAERFGHDASQSRDGSIKSEIVIANYEILHHFDSSKFGGVVCDESSILKSFDGSTKAAVTEFMRLVPYRLLGTATAAPNDFVELGTSSEALGNLGYMDMLSRFFTNKENKMASKGRNMRFGNNGMDLGWRIKPHAEEHFWRWIASWSRAIRSPADYGFDASRYVMPKLIQREHVAKGRKTRSGMLFALEAHGLGEEREENRITLTERCEKAGEVLADADSAVAWCNLNDESTLLTSLIDGAVELTGSDSLEKKEEILSAYAKGEIRVMVTKPKIASFGLNWQHAHRITYFPTHSYEQMYQAIRRMWRFGQKNDVVVDFIVTEGIKNTMHNLQRKAAQADEMFSKIVQFSTNALKVEKKDIYTNNMEMPQWALPTKK